MYYILLLSCLNYYSTYYCSFILPLTRSLSDDPGFACPDLRSEISLYQIFSEISLRRHPFQILRYLCDLFLLSYLSLFSYLLWSLTFFCRYSCTYLCWTYCGSYIYSLYWGLAYIRESIFTQRIYVAVASPYPWDRGVTFARGFELFSLAHGFRSFFS